MIVRRVEALGRFLETDDGKNLLAGYRRAANILRAEEKKDGAGAFEGAHDKALLVLAQEKALAEALAIARRERGRTVAKEDFEGAMRALATLARAGRRLLPRRHRQRRRSGPAAQSPAAAQRIARGGSHGRGFFENRGVIAGLTWQSAVIAREPQSMLGSPRLGRAALDPHDHVDAGDLRSLGRLRQAGDGDFAFGDVEQRVGLLDQEMVMRRDVGVEIGARAVDRDFVQQARLR